MSESENKEFESKLSLIVFSVLCVVNCGVGMYYFFNNFHLYFLPLILGFCFAGLVGWNITDYNNAKKQVNGTGV